MSTDVRQDLLSDLATEVGGASGGAGDGGSRVQHAVDAARAALPGWRSTPPGDRAAALRAAAAAIRERADDLADLHTAETGRLRGQALGSALVAADLLDEAAVAGPLDAGRALGGDPSALDLVRREPRGVVAVVTAWNDPYPAAAGLLAAALVTGNTVVHKPSERSAVCGRALADLVAARLPAGVLEVLDGDAEVGEALVAHPDVAAVAHVGSTEAGRRIAQVAGARGAHLLLENGGNDVLLVDDGVDPVLAAEQAAIGAFTNSGQLCTSVERIVVHRDVAEAFVDALVQEAAGWRAGDPRRDATRLGPMVDARAAGSVLAQLDDAVAAGAQVLLGGGTVTVPGVRVGDVAGREPADAVFVPATVVVDVPTTGALWTRETFGPVAAVRVARSWEEMLALADEDAYGLAATVLTASVAHALEAAHRLDVGTVKVNGVFGGAPGGSADPRRASGRGRGFGPDLREELTVAKAVHVEAPAEGWR